MMTEECITALFYEVDEQLCTIPKHPEAHLWPSEVVTLGLLHALKGVGNRPFYRWLTRDYRPWFPRLPERTRLFRLLKTHQDWARAFLAAPTVLGVIDTYGIELIHPMREGRSPQQIGRKGLSNHRWIVGGKLCLLLNQYGLVVGWDCGPANVADNTFQWLIQQVDGRMIVLSDTGFHAAEGDPSNLKLCQRGEWQDRMLVETVLSMLTLVCHLKKVMHRGWAYFQARLAFTMAAFNVLVQWHGLQLPRRASCPSRWLNLVCKIPISFLVYQRLTPLVNRNCAGRSAEEQPRRPGLREVSSPAGSTCQVVDSRHSFPGPPAAAARQRDCGFHPHPCAQSSRSDIAQQLAAFHGCPAGERRARRLSVNGSGALPLTLAAAARCGLCGAGHLAA
jgi:hypothetical protein